MLRLGAFGGALLAGRGAGLAGAAAVAEEPVPPCAGPSVPGYVEPGPVPAVRVWPAEIGGRWQPPACLGWEPLPGGRILALAGRFRADGGAEPLLARIAAVSGLLEARTWSVRRQRWQPMLVDASALETADPGARRPDFQLAELRTGAPVHFLEKDDEPVSAIVNRLWLREPAPGRIEIDIANALPVTLLGLAVIGAGGIRTRASLEREPAGELWRYFSLTRLVSNLPAFLEPPDAALVNRAVAMFRHLARLPTDGAPPVAPDRDWRSP
jgi:hypothetical protein